MTRTIRWPAAAGIAAAMLAATAAGAAPRAAPGTAPAPATPEVIVIAQAETKVSFTAQQAQRGLQAYTQACRDCHGGNLDDGEFGGAPLRGSHFDQVYVGAPASALFGYIQSAMPPDRPNQLPPETYADITAFILERNGFQAGGTELPSDLEALDAMMLTR
jgi:mono/diheme cytochrome c family protein